MRASHCTSIPKKEGNGNGDKDGHDDRQGFVGVDKITQSQCITVVYFDKCQGKSTSQKFEYH